MTAATASNPNAQPFSLGLPEHGVIRRGLMRMMRPLLERLFGLRRMNELYRRTILHQPSTTFYDNCLAEHGVRIEVSDEDLARVPKDGPLIVVSNHPFGGIDGMILASILHRVRPDVRILANYMLHRIPDLREIFFFVDPFGGPEAQQRNLAGTKNAIRWVKQGGALAIYPAGEVSHLTMKRREVTDPHWLPTAGRLAQQTGASVLPLFFHGRNSFMFQLLGLIHPRLRTAWLGRELLNKRGQTVHVEIGNVIAPNRIAQFPTPEELTAYLRARTYLLRGRSDKTRMPVEKKAKSPKPRMLSLAPAIKAELLAGEVAALPPEQLLAQSGKFAVYHATSAQVPQVLQEIGRLREVTFRAAGEGTGNATDLDRFDEDYRHLFVWHAESQKLIGAYRMGLTDEITARHGIGGLYTSTLFNFSRQLLDQLGPSIELGRSFVRAEYQKEFAPLMLLWKGIGHFVVQNPRYRMLFGPVSISNEYASTTRDLLMAFLEINNADHELGKMVTPKNPPRKVRLDQFAALASSTIVQDVDQVGELVEELESDRRGVPVLLRQYLKLNAKALGFNVDPDFGDVLDALMVVDLTNVEPMILTRYLSREGMNSFLSHHGATV